MHVVYVHTHVHVAEYTLLLNHELLLLFLIFRRINASCLPHTHVMYTYDVPAWVWQFYNINTIMSSNDRAVCVTAVIGCM